MRTYKKTFVKGILLVLSIGAVLLTWLTPGYSGEWEPIISGAVKNSLEIGIKNTDFTTNKVNGSEGSFILIIPVGMEVKWVNTDPLTTVNGELGLMPHGVQIADSSEKAFTASPILTQEHNTFSYTFSEDGTYTFRCFIHPFMKGKIVVVNLSLSGNLPVNSDGESK